MSNAMGTIGTILGGVFIYLVLLSILPFALIWAVNALGFTVAYSLKTWAAMLIIIGIFGTKR